MGDEKKRVWSVRPKVGGVWLVVRALAELDNGLALEASVGEAFDLRLEEMTEAEIEKLGEFDGW